MNISALWSWVPGLGNNSNETARVVEQIPVVSSNAYTSDTRDSLNFTSGASALFNDPNPTGIQEATAQIQKLNAVISTVSAEHNVDPQLVQNYVAPQLQLANRRLDTYIKQQEFNVLNFEMLVGLADKPNFSFPGANGSQIG